MKFGLRELIFLLVLLAVPTVSMFYVFKPRNNEIKAALNEISTKQTRLDKLAEVTAKIDDLGLAIERGVETIARIEEKLPTEQNVEHVLERVYEIATENLLTVKSIKTDDSQSAGQYMELPLNMVVEGQFDGFYQFLLEVENLQRITRMHDLKIERQDSRNGGGRGDVIPGNMKAEFVLAIYFEPNSA